MAINAYERETLKNYFIRNGGFVGLSETESKLYNNISQNKFRGFAPEEEIDCKAPGGMQTIFFNLMGFPKKDYEKSPTGKIESYLIYLVTLFKNDIELTNREYNYLNQFVKYYEFESLEDMVEYIEPLIYPKYNLSDVLLTFSIYSYFLENDKEIELKKFVSSLKLGNIYELFEEKNMNLAIEYVKKKLLPTVEIVDEHPILINDNCLQIPHNMSIMWSDLVIIGILGLKFKGLYRPHLQLGNYLKYKMQGNLIGVNSSALLTDEIHRRKFRCKNLLDFWGIKEENFPTVSFKRGYTIYPFFDTHNSFIPKDDDSVKSQKVYCIWFSNGSYLITDIRTFEYVYRAIPNINFTDKYMSRFGISDRTLACIEQNGVIVPVAETLTNSYPVDSNFSNLTSSNLGVL
jgi:hypothetical protein